jgi:hypothetical protein
MKKLLIGYIVFVVLFISAIFYHAAESATIKKLWICDGLTGGTSTYLDGINSATAGLPNHALAMVMDQSAGSGVSEILFMIFETGVSAAENTSTHPYIIMPDNQPDSGVWVELSGISAFGDN